MSHDTAPHKPHKVTEDGQVVTGKGKLFTVILKAGSDTATLILYDSTEASGTELCNISITTAAGCLIAPFEGGVDYENGIYADIGGTNPVAIVICTQ